MPLEDGLVYEFGEFRLDRVSRKLLHRERPVPLTSKCFDLLVLLVQSPGEVLTKEHLIATLWPDTFVEEGNLTQNISVVRKAELARRTVAPAPSEDLSLKLAEAQSELQALRSQQTESVLKSTLLSAVSGENFFDANLAADLLRQSARVVDGKVIFCEPDGSEMIGADFQPLTPAQAARQLAAQKPFLVRSTVHGGSGSKLADHAPAPRVKLEDLFGKNSNGAAANKLSLHDPIRYKQLRREAVAKGLL